MHERCCYSKTKPRRAHDMFRLNGFLSRWHTGTIFLPVTSASCNTAPIFTALTVPSRLNGANKINFDETGRRIEKDESLKVSSWAIENSGGCINVTFEFYARSRIFFFCLEHKIKETPRIRYFWQGVYWFSRVTVMFRNQTAPLSYYNGYVTL